MQDFSLISGGDSSEASLGSANESQVLVAINAINKAIAEELALRASNKEITAQPNEFVPSVERLGGRIKISFQTQQEKNTPLQHEAIRKFYAELMKKTERSWTQKMLGMNGEHGSFRSDESSLSASNLWELIYGANNALRKPIDPAALGVGRSR